MGTRDDQLVVLAAKFESLLPHLDERQRRLLLGAEARAVGHGGIRLVARAAGVREATVSLGMRELDSGQEPLGRVRIAGGGRKRVADLNPALRTALLALVEPDTRGDPMSPLRWTTKSTRKLAQELVRQGHQVCADTVGDILREEGFSLQGNAKTLEGTRHPDRDAQFRYLNEQARTHQDAGDPVISVDTKKKELVGLFKNNGREWHPSHEPLKVSSHDFPAQALGRAVPYGIYDVAANTGWVNVGTDHDTAEFAVASIRRWWNAAGRSAYPAASRLLITADAGGSNGYRTRGWKTHLAALADETGLAVTVCHLPPGTSKWNRIEHRLFSHITMNWRGRPLTSHEVVIQSISATTTRTGLTVHAELDTGQYPTGVQVSDEELAALPITRHRFHGDWNYTLHPARLHPAPEVIRTGSAAGTSSGRVALRLPHHLLRDPALTGMTHQQFDSAIASVAPALENQRERSRTQRRGGRPSQVPGAGPKEKLTPADRILITVLYLRKIAPQALLGQLFGVTTMTASRVIREVRPLLEAAGHQATASTARFRTPADVATYLQDDAAVEINSAGY